MVVACQIYLGVGEVMQTCIDIGIPAFERAAKKCTSIAQSVLDLRASISPVDSFLKASVESFERLLDRHKLLPGRYVKLDTEPGRLAIPRTGEALEDNPGRGFHTMTGFILANCLTDFHVGVVLFANHRHYIAVTAHPYAALRSMGVLSCQWQDMETIISNLHVKHSTSLRVDTRYNKQAQSRLLTNIGGPSVPKTLKTEWEKADHLHRQVTTMARDPPIQITSPYIKSISEDKKYGKLGSHQTRNKCVESFLRTATEMALKEADMPKSNKNSNVVEYFTRLQTLQSLNLHLIEDESKLYVNYAELVFHCKSLFDDIHCERDQHLTTKDASAYLRHLSTACQLIKSEPDDPFVLNVANKLKIHIDQKGGELAQHASDLTDGFAQLPKFEQDYQHFLPEDQQERVLASKILEAAGAQVAFTSLTMAAYHPAGSAKFETGTVTIFDGALPFPVDGTATET